jgi:hypothetical protein
MQFYRKLNEEISSPKSLEEIFVTRKGCNLNDTPLNTFFSFVSVDHYDKHLAYLNDLDNRMMELNYEKWSGNYKPIAPTTIKFVKEAEEQHIIRDEL